MHLCNSRLRFRRSSCKRWADRQAEFDGNVLDANCTWLDPMGRSVLVCLRRKIVYIIGSWQRSMGSR